VAHNEALIVHAEYLRAHLAASAQQQAAPAARLPGAESLHRAYHTPGLDASLD